MIVSITTTNTFSLKLHSISLKQSHQEVHPFLVEKGHFPHRKSVSINTRLESKNISSSFLQFSFSYICTYWSNSSSIFISLNQSFHPLNFVLYCITVIAIPISRCNLLFFCYSIFVVIRQGKNTGDGDSFYSLFFEF